MTPARILVVEDSATQAAALAILLESERFETVIARRAERALEILGAQQVDLVLSDVVMPGMDGYELCRRIKNDDRWRDLPVVLLTSLTDPLAIVRGLESGADHYVTKPYEPESLLLRVRAVLARRGAGQGVATTPFTVELLGTPFTISATKEQILELLVSSYSDLMRTSEAVREAERRAQFLAEATERLGSSLEVPLVLRDLANLVVPRIAAVCAVDLLEGEAASQRMQTVHAFKDAPPEPATEGASGVRALSPIARRAVTEGGIQISAVATRDEIFELARSPFLVEALESSGAYTLLVVPLMSRKRALGILQLLAPAGARAQSPEVVLLVEDLARRAAVALENALLYSEAQRVTRARDDMLAIVSHDLRNPLNTIQMSTSFLLDLLEEPGATVPLVPQLQLIRRATARGNALIQDLLDVSRIESGTLAVDAAPTSAAGLLADAIVELSPLIADKGLTLEHAWIGDDAQVPADRGRVAQVFSNLVGNAIKFTSRGGTVGVTGQVVGEMAEFTVRDSGTGIAEGDLPRLFDRYWKASKASRTGAGLGLFIVKGIIEQHRGTISVESAMGAGTTFRFSLPGAFTPRVGQPGPP